jgi:hypothetical protein
MSDHLASVIEIRPAHPEDERAISRLGQLDSARVPPAPLVLAFERGELRAAISLSTGAAIADPFAPTARLVDLLRAEADPLRQRAPARSGFRLIRRRVRAEAAG